MFYRVWCLFGEIKRFPIWLCSRVVQWNNPISRCWCVFEQDAELLQGRGRDGKSRRRDKSLSLWESGGSEWKRINRIDLGAFLLHIRLSEDTGQGGRHALRRTTPPLPFKPMMCWLQHFHNSMAAPPRYCALGLQFHRIHPAAELRIPHLVRQPEVVCVLKMLPLCRILLKLCWWGKKHRHTTHTKRQNK